MSGRPEKSAQRPFTVADLALAACQAAGIYLLTVCTVSLVVHAVVWQATSSRPPGRYPFATPRGYAGAPALWLGCGIAGLALLAGYHVARRARPRRPGEVPGEFYPLVAAVFCVVLTVLVAVPGQTARLPHRQLPWAIPAALVTGAGYILRMIGLTLVR